MRQSTTCGQSGFSVPELLIVLVASLIIAASALPFVDLIIDQFNLVMAGQRILNEMHYTRMRAVSGNETFRVRFGPVPDQYRVELENGTLHAGPFDFPAGVTLNDVDGGDPISFPGDEVLFLPSGTLPLAGLGSAGRIRLINQARLRVDVVVDSGGMVRMTPTYTSPTAPF